MPSAQSQNALNALQTLAVEKASKGKGYLC